ncbi:hypothetical protein Aduo_009961 [Ancylostoma duodenale]
MKTVIAVLALCTFAHAQSCPKTSEITKQDIDAVTTVAFVTVKRANGNVYDLLYETYFDVTKTPAPARWSTLRTIRIGCDNVKLNLDSDYVLGCKEENSDCKFVRSHDQLTAEEKKLLKI